jgi:spermidine synthase
LAKLHHWIVEFEKTTLIHPISNTIAIRSSAYQEIAIVETIGFGRALFLDGVAQSSAMDEHIYHEALIHPALVAHANPQHVFIAGGGEGALLRKVLKHNTVKRVVMVDLDFEALLPYFRVEFENYVRPIGLMVKNAPNVATYLLTAKGKVIAAQLSDTPTHPLSARNS